MQNSFNGRVVGSTVTFDWGDGYAAFYYGTTSVSEILPGGQILGIWGTMVASAAPQTISGTLVGGFTFREGNTSSRMLCRQITQWCSRGSKSRTQRQEV